MNTRLRRLHRRIRSWHSGLTHFLISAVYLAALVIVAVHLSSYLITPVTSPSPVAPYTPLVSQNLPAPQISAQHLFVMDVASRQPLFTKDADARIYPASTTKMMTALVAVDHYPLDQIITITRRYPEGQDIGLAPGEQISVEQLLYALLVQSANDAAEVLAENYCAPVAAPDAPLCGRASFISAMNSKAYSMHLYHTHFKNPSGLDEEGHYSTAADLSRLALAVMDNPYLAHIVGTENAVITSSDYSSSHILSNVNELVGKIPGVLGVKTGFTDLAGQSLVTLVDQYDRPLLITVLGSSDRFADTQNLIEWAYSNFFSSKITN